MKGLEGERPNGTSALRTMTPATDGSVILRVGLDADLCRSTVPGLHPCDVGLEDSPGVGAIEASGVDTVLLEGRELLVGRVGHGCALGRREQRGVEWLVNDDVG